MQLIIVKNTLSKGIKKFISKSDKVTEEALMKGGLQLLNWIVNGSPKNSRVPPVLTGMLRGSGSVFVSGKLAGTTPKTGGAGEPNLSFAGKKNETVIGFNTAYAKKLHEEEWNPGPRSVQSGDVGNKFVESHLKSDAKDWLRLIAKLMKKEL